MRRIALLENSIQEYAWGSRTALAELCGRPAPSARPEAELWMGAHPLAPSRVALEGRRVSLVELIEADPVAILGRRVLERFGPRLPFLLKVLAAERPLSIQAHPDARQAREGFAREEAGRIPRDAPERCYRDAHAKPEILCALGPFRALYGFRPVAQIGALLDRLAVPDLAPVRALLEGSDDRAALRVLLEALLHMSRARAARLVEAAAEAAAARTGDDPAFAWIAKLADEHPGDVGALAPALLQLVDLEPEQALYLDAGILHGYLGGVGVELMGNSDNVLRGGLTRKHVDVAELLRVVRFEPGRTRPLAPEAVDADAARYRTPTAEFELVRLRLRPGAVHRSRAAQRGVEILLCVEGALRVVPDAGEPPTLLPRGASCLVPDAAGPYRLEGAGGGGSAYRASVPP